jgi:hypothetical protein
MAFSLAAVDRRLSDARPAYAWLGQIGVVALGVHLVADRLDDFVYASLVAAPIPWGEGAPPTWIAAGVALVLELVVVLRAAGMLLLTPGRPRLSLRVWWEARSVDAFVVPTFWFATAAAGSWTVGMAAEDVLAPTVGGEPARWAAVLLAGLVAWRLGFTGWRRVTGAIEAPASRRDGLRWAPILVPFAALALWYGLPVWSLW